MIQIMVEVGDLSEVRSFVVRKEVHKESNSDHNQPQQIKTYDDSSSYSLGVTTCDSSDVELPHDEQTLLLARVLEYANHGCKDDAEEHQ